MVFISLNRYHRRASGWYHCAHQLGIIGVRQGGDMAFHQLGIQLSALVMCVWVSAERATVTWLGWASGGRNGLWLLSLVGS